MRNRRRLITPRKTWSQDVRSYLWYHTHRLAIRICGIFLISTSFFSLLSLSLYSSDHTSWNTSSSRGIEAPLGNFSAFIADTLLQIFGPFGWLLPILILAWGIRLMLFWPFKNPKKRFFSAVFGLALICFSFSKVAFFYSAAGLVILNLYLFAIKAFFPHDIVPWVLYSTLTLSIFSGVFFYLYAFGLPYTWWKATLSSILKISISLSKKIYTLIRKIIGKEKEYSFDKTDYSSFSQGELNYAEKDSETSSFEEENDIDSTPIVKKSIFRKKKLKAENILSRKTRTLSNFRLPSVNFITSPPKNKNKKASDEELQENAQALQRTLEEFGVQGQITAVNPGPVVTLYEFKPAPGVKTSRIIALADDIARSMSALSARVSVIPGKNAMGIEMPNEERETVFFRPLLTSEVYESSAAQLPLILGRDIGGTPTVADLSRMPHLLVAGTTGSGKSVAINTMILSLLYYLTPAQCKFIMIDPKMLELSVYEGIPHLLTPVVTDPKKAVVALKWAVREMEDRYQRMSKVGVRNIQGYNQKIQQAKENGEELTRRVQTGYDQETGNPIFEQQSLDMSPLPYIVVIVDEMADLMLVAGKEIESTIQRLAQMARAAGIHLIMATQRPSVDVITGTIKANFPTRISFQVSSKIDSRTILSEPGAEQLLGQGDMLFMAGGGRIQRIHGPFVSDESIEKIVNYLREQETPDYIEDIIKDEDNNKDFNNSGSKEKDPLFDKVVALCLQEKKSSISFIQRHFQIGYNRAARIMDQLEEEHIVSSANHTGRRKILIS